LCLRNGCGTTASIGHGALAVTEVHGRLQPSIGILGRPAPERGGVGLREILERARCEVESYELEGGGIVLSRVATAISRLLEGRRAAST